MSDPILPRGWSFYTYAAAGAALQIVIPAAGIGVKHVLDVISVKIEQFAAGAIYSPGIDILNGAVSLGAPNLALLGLTGAVGNIDSDEVPGPLIGTPATSMTVRLAGGAALPAGVQGVLRITGRDI